MELLPDDIEVVDVVVVLVVLLTPGMVVEFMIIIDIVVVDVIFNAVELLDSLYPELLVRVLVPDCDPPGLLGRAAIKSRTAMATTNITIPAIISLLSTVKSLC